MCAQLRRTVRSAKSGSASLKPRSRVNYLFFLFFLLFFFSYGTLHRQRSGDVELDMGALQFHNAAQPVAGGGLCWRATR